MNMDSQDYLEIAVSVADEMSAEIIEAVVAEIGFDSFMYEDGVLKCYIQSDLFDEAAFQESLGMLEGEYPYRVEKMAAVNWNAEWEQSGFTPIVVDGEVTIHPFGTEAQTPISIVLKPEMAFGTGHHNTTYMMMQTMLSLRDVIADGSVMDLGCGTAILAILAAKLGSKDVCGIDIDAVAARSAYDNVRLNGEDFPVLCGDASDLKAGAYDVLLANIHRNIIIADLHRYATAVRKGGWLLLSGFYESDVADIEAAAAQNGFILEGRRSSEEWACLALRRG